MVGYDSEGSRKYIINSAGPGINIQDVGGVSVTIWNRKLGGDWGDAQVPDVIPPSGGATDHRDDGKIIGRQRVGISRIIGGNGLCGDPPNQIIHKEAVYSHGK